MVSGGKPLLYVYADFDIDPASGTAERRQYPASS